MSKINILSGATPVIPADEDRLASMSFHNSYKRMSEDPNNFSKWWPNLLSAEKSFKNLLLPGTIIFQVPEDVAEAFFMERPGDLEIIRKWAAEIMPTINKMGFVPMFIKNGTFSDKYYFQANCLPLDPLRLASSIQRINYEAMCVDAEGITELVVRKFIPADRERVPCIYGGLPLRPEFRVFYDFDRHIPLYTVNYWDWDTCAHSICRDATDRIVYSSQYGHIQSTFERLKSKVEDMVTEDLKNVTGMTGVWSVDILLEEADVADGVIKEFFWLIDMARGVQSTYYDDDRVKRHQADFDNRESVAKKMLDVT